ncbi:hypothetical protein UFOVP1264_68 [uncultured Caudovirales phage]|uniref:Uncharacterized protein n=1 Tax=uncultured Caudovirales phage TaxID=2100421 RepID=A0A6J5RBN3_9CAUD|nr:hypothetical protein UFOVP1264_68 [uncultured Caudovirales phage]
MTNEGTHYIQRIVDDALKALTQKTAGIIIDPNAVIKPYWLDQTKHYFILDNTTFCCDEKQFVYECKVCKEIMECYYCSFNYDEPHCTEELNEKEV